MAEASILNSPEFRVAFFENERAERIKTGKVASALVVFLMPAGISLDFFVYKQQLPLFLFLRLLSSALACVLWYLHTTEFGKNKYKLLGLPIAWLPAFFIGLMIYRTEGPTSPYYAGLNLILLAVSVVVHWNVRESLLAVAGVLAMYSAVSLPKAEAHQLPIIFNNYYFLILTGIIVVVGNFIFNQLRFSEFASRFELNASRRALEVSNQELNRKREELEGSNQQLSQKTGELEQTLIELRRTQEQLVTKEKQASLGVWSAGIIHEMNNPLNFARTGLYALRNKDKHLPEDQRQDFREIMADVEEGINRVHTIVSDLRTYAHPSTADLEDVLVSDVVRVALRFFSADLQGHIEVVQNIPPTQTVFASRNKLIQVLGNLLQNSIDALKTKQFAEGYPVITLEGREENGRSKLVLRDNGSGIEKQHLDKIFDPFFTTKDVGKGMGLGLGICYRIVQEFGGTISVRSEPGQFCEFTLDFPVERPQSLEASEG